MANRAILFIDGNNWYHHMADINVGDRLNLDYRSVSQKAGGAGAYFAEVGRPVRGKLAA